MKPAIKAMITTAAAALVLSATGCSGSSSPDSESPVQDNALSKVDPCAILKPNKAAQNGLPEQGEPFVVVDSEPGCKYDGDHAGIVVSRVADETLEKFGKRSAWSSFQRLKVNERDGAEAHQSGEADDECTTAISAGGGVVAVDASAVDPRKEFDACAESLKVAKLIEPDLPK